MKVIVGLGNPGAEYEWTPHNLGFAAVEIAAARWGFSWRRVARWRADVARGTYRGEAVALLKPRTYMNLSGESVGPFCSYYKIDISDVMVISDDVCLPWGRMRLRADGSDGGHKGLRSLIAHLGGREFPRIRIGCGPESGVIADRVNYVLGRMRADSSPWVHAILETSVNALETVLESGVEAAMTKYNGLKIEPPAATR
jgi:PTH1 family peptidyl-tRNA hydrolase